MASPDRLGIPWRPELDALRCFAFLAVFAHHALPDSPGLYERAGLPTFFAHVFVALLRAGAFGVDLFFCLSAYLITEILTAHSKKQGRIDVTAFWMRRALRIWPLYFAALILAKLAVPAILPNDFLSNEHLLAYALLAGNWSTALLGWPASVVAPLWSVSIEEQFYLVWPVLLSLFGRHRILLAVSMFVISLAARALLVSWETPHPGIWCNTFARLDPIAAGALLSFVLDGRILRLGMSRSVLLALAGLAAAAGAAHWGAFAGPPSLVVYPVIAGSAVALLTAMLSLGAGWLEGRLGLCLVWLGKVSFGLYVFHVFAIALSQQIEVRGTAGVLLRTVFALGVTVLLAGASYRWLESPFLRLKARFSGGKEEKPASSGQPI